MSLEIVPTDEFLVKSLAAAFASAFEVDPLLTYLMPDEKIRWRVLPHLMEANIRLTLPGAQTWTLRETGQVLGGIAAMPPGGYPYPILRELHYNWQIFWNPNPWTPPLLRFLRVLSYTGYWSRMHCKRPHWYVFVLGVHRQFHGCGHGRRLMEHIIQRADAGGMPVYLETQTESNVPFYKHLGFHITEAHHPRADGPQTWGLIRSAKTE